MNQTSTHSQNYQKHQQAKTGSCRTSAQRLITRKRSRHRQSIGSVLVEGVVALSLIVAGTVLGTLLLVNTGVTSTDMIKLTFITTQAAQYAANMAASTTLANAQTQTPIYVQALLTSSSMPISNLTVNIVQTTANSQKAYQTSISVSGFQLIGTGSVFPTTISLQNVATAVPSFEPTVIGYIGLNEFTGIGSGVAQFPDDAPGAAGGLGPWAMVPVVNSWNAPGNNLHAHTYGSGELPGTIR